MGTRMFIHTLRSGRLGFWVGFGPIFSDLGPSDPRNLDPIGIRKFFSGLGWFWSIIKIHVQYS